MGCWLFMDTLGNKIQEEKDKILNLMLIIFAVVGGIVVAFSVTRISHIEMNASLWTQISGIALAIPVAIFRKKLPFTFKVIFASFLPLVMGFMGVLSFGLIDGSVMLFISSVVIASILSGTRFGLVIVFISGLFSTGLAYLALNGYVTFNVDEHAYQYQFESWLIFISAFVALSAISSYLIGLMSDLAYRNIDILEEKTKELEAANLTKDRLFQLIAHDLRSPFQGLISGLELFVDDSNVFDEEQQKKLFSSMLRDSTSTFSMLENLLYWSRTRVGDLKLDSKYFELPEFVEESLMPYCRLAKQKNIDVSMEASDGTLAFADQSSVRIILSNLFQNAIKFTENGGWIRIKIESRDGSSIVTISDNGLGISEADVKKIFYSQERFSTRGTENESGTGLGISISLELAELNKGSLRYQENTSGGSDFILELPAKP